MNLLDRAISGEELTEQEWLDIINGKLDKDEVDYKIIDISFRHIDKKEDGKTKWYKVTEIIIEYSGNYYGIYWEHGITDMRNSGYQNCRIYEVEKVPVTTYEWRIKG